MLVYPMKFLLGRSRPSAEEGAQDYRPFNVRGSMPSFHTTEAFAVASVISDHVANPWVSALAYGLAAGVGLSRLEADRHWASDVLLSAAIGTAVGKAIVALNRQRRDSRVSVVPLVDGEMWGAAVQVRY
jgi:membrane-associated phospholipid phosphatase